MASKGIIVYRCLYFTLFTGFMPRTWHGHSQVGTSAQAKGPCFQPMWTTSDFLRGKLPPWPLCQVISTAKLTEHTVAPLLKLGIMTNGSKLMWLEGFSSNNCLEYFKTCYKPCLGHRGLDSRLRNNVMFQSLVAVIIRNEETIIPFDFHFVFPYEVVFTRNGFSVCFGFLFFYF